MGNKSTDLIEQLLLAALRNRLFQFRVDGRRPPAKMEFRLSISMTTQSVSSRSIAWLYNVAL